MNNTAKTIKVLIADDHSLIRRGLASVLSSRSDIEVVGEARNGAEAIRQAEALRPDVAILDLHMPEIDGVEAIKIIRERLPETKVIILTTYDTDDYIFPGLHAGAHSYLLKDSSPDELVDAVRSVWEGESPIEPRIAARVLERLNAPPPDEKAENLLSDRERQIIELAASGATNRQIADQLFLSENTIKSHLHRIFEKLDVGDRTQAVTEAARRGIIEI